MIRNRNIYNFLAGIFLVTGLVAFFMFSSGTKWAKRTERDAAALSRAIDRRLDILESYMQKAMEQEDEEWLDLAGLPSDMVVYRYCDDTLQSWVNEFPVSNDKIISGTYMPFITSPSRSYVSPLSSIGEEFSFVDMGSSWYLARAGTIDDCRIIAGLEVTGSASGGNRINPLLKLNSAYTIRPLSEDGGMPVSVKGVPMFKLLCETKDPRGFEDSSLLWTALAFLIAAAFSFLLARRTVPRMCMTLATLVLVMAWFFIWGMGAGSRMLVFSPVLYAGGSFFYSLGAVVICNLTLFLICSCLYIARNDIAAKLGSDKARWAVVAAAGAGILALLAYTCYLLSNIILNSGISLELLKPAQWSPFCIVVYISFITLLMGVPMLVQIAGIAAPAEAGKRVDAFSVGNRLLFALLVAVFLVSLSAVLSLRKEKARVEVLANRLSFDRDISLELRLRWVENQIAEDMIISALSVFNNSAATIQGRIVDSYLSAGEQDYSVSVYVFNDSNNTTAAQAQLAELVRDGVPIADNSRFLFVKRDNMRSYYLGVFMYLIEGNGVSRVLVCLESKEIRGNKGYAGIFGITPPGKVAIPDGYSYARYEGPYLKSSHGSFAYPTRLGQDMVALVYENFSESSHAGGYVHFFNLISDNELVVISRPRNVAITYLVSAILVAIAVFLLFTILGLASRKRRTHGWNFFRTRILGLLTISLVLALVAMAAVSVYFVSSRNESNMHSIISDKISSISSMMEAGIDGGVLRPEDLYAPQLRRLMEQVGSDTNSDVTLYSSDGRLVMSTTPMVFERRLLSNRIDGTAYSQIVYHHKKYHIQKEKRGHVGFYSMYAPVMNRQGDLLAIICSPYNESNYNFEKDAFIHTMTVIAIFILCLMSSIFLVTRIVDKMFRPLGEMSNKMNSADLNSLEQIEYRQNDEIASIVKAYNRMVVELSESSKKLAQAERDKAWSEMARQVAHEIKNPLTPMKLQLQRVIRLKQKGDPAWLERFDEAGKVILDHIDILTDTANEFSTFAKLYTEEPTEIVLDALIREEIAMFDNKDNIEFLYLGFDDVKVMGPKPQLTRVFVNLINNAVQAIGDAADGKIVVSLRNSMQEGYYDIVFDDNGPGVSEENAARLFTPNFTTKNGGSGLGLAISRSILERCGAKIDYHRSFTLGGACFTITYPKWDTAGIISDGRKSGQDNL